jgi:hypothetical protein
MPPTIDVIRPWASTGDRETPPDVKIDLGWRPGEQPAVEWENERQNLRDNILKELAEYVNAGIPLSDLQPTTTPSGGSMTVNATVGDPSISMKESDPANFSGVSPAAIGVFSGAFAGTQIQPDGTLILRANATQIQMEPIKTFAFDASTLSWSAVGNNYDCTDAVVLLGVPWRSRIISASISCTNVGGDILSIPLAIMTDVAGDGSGNDKIILMTGFAPPTANNAVLYVTFENAGY